MNDAGKITSLDIGNNKFGSKGAFHVAEYIKKTKSLQWLNMYMNDIGDQVQLLLYPSSLFTNSSLIVQRLQ